MEKVIEKNKLAGVVAYRQPDGTFGPAVPFGDTKPAPMSEAEMAVLDAFAERFVKVFKKMYDGERKGRNNEA